MMPDPKPPARRGLPLLALGVGLAIVGLASSMTVATLKPGRDEARRTRTWYKLSGVENALSYYRMMNDGSLPCPADITLAETSPDFGVEAANKGYCAGGSPAANRVAGEAVEGGVPVAALNLPRESAYDDYGRKLVYAVDRRYTQANLLSTGAVNTFAPDKGGGVMVRDAARGARTAGMYVVMSHGPNGHGGYTASGTRVSAGSANPDELENCDCDARAANTTYNAHYLQGSNSLTAGDDRFDDVVRYKEWWWQNSIPIMCQGR